MTGGTFALIVGALSVVGTYLAKRVIDYLLPPDRHWTALDRFSRHNDDANHPEEEADHE